jgi:hypothetical protein
MCFANLYQNVLVTVVSLCARALEKVTQRELRTDRLRSVLAQPQSETLRYPNFWYDEDSLILSSDG